MRRAVLVLLAGACAFAGCRMGPKGPFCQSCAMPMDKPELFGTNADGTESQEYCTYCYQKGQFTEPDISMQEMMDKCVAHMVEQKTMPEEKARALMAKHLPNLKRWRQ